MEQVIKNGWLYKEGGALRKLQKRWFVLTNAGLSYFKNERVGHPQGQIGFRDGVLCTTSPAASRPHTFVLRTKNRDYVLVADSQAAMHEWSSTISFCVKKAVERRLGAHNLKKLSVSAQVECACCHERIPHMGRQAFRCDDCGLIIHTKCYGLLLDSTVQMVYCRVGTFPIVGE